MVNYPTSLDDDSTLFDVIDAIDDVRDFQHNALKDAVIAIETLLGITGAHAFAFWDAVNPAKTRYWSIDFISINGVCYVRDGTFTLVYASEWTETSTSNTNVHIPLHLPDGATITALRSWMQKSDSGNNFYIHIRRVTNSSGAQSLLATVEADDSMQEVADTTPDDVVNNNTYAYMLHIAKSGSGTSGRVRAIQVDYTITEP